MSAEEFAGQVATFAGENGAQMVVIPWSGQGGIGGTLQPIEEAATAPNVTTPSTGPSSSPLSTYNPFEVLFSGGDRSAAIVRSQFVRKVFLESPVDVALFIDRSHLKSSTSPGFDGVDFEALCGVGHHIFLPFFGGPDDRLALSLVVQLCSNPLISATVVRIKRSDEEVGSSDDIDDAKMLSVPNQLTISVSLCVLFYTLG